MQRDTAIHGDCLSVLRQIAASNIEAIITDPPHGIRLTHPNEKPAALIRQLVEAVTPPGALILDPFLGSGTTVGARQEPRPALRRRRRRSRLC